MERLLYKLCMGIQLLLIMEEYRTNTIMAKRDRNCGGVIIAIVYFAFWMKFICILLSLCICSTILCYKIDILYINIFEV